MTRARPLIAVLLAASAAACESEVATTCADLATVETCRGSECERAACRLDHVCAAGACVPWTEADLTAGFRVVADPTRAGRFLFQVEPGGFPRRFAEQIRFSFGDGIAGWPIKDLVRHEYAKPGVYPVELEVRLEGGRRILRASKLVVYDPVPPEAPAVFFTVNEIPGFLNGSIPFTSDRGTPRDTSDDTTEDFHLLLPAHGFSIEATLLGAAHADPVSPERVRLTASVPIGGGRVAAGQDLSDRFVLEGAPDGKLEMPRLRWTVSREDAFPAGPIRLELEVTRSSGAVERSALDLEVIELGAATDPFDRPMEWLLRFEMDLFATTAEHRDDGTTVLHTVPGENGVPDFKEELLAIGAQSANAASAEGSAAYLRWIEREIVRETYRFYEIAADGTPVGGIPIKIFASGEQGAPDPAGFAAEHTFSMMRLGGYLENNLGRSYFSPYNERRIDDTRIGLGVGTSRLVQLMVGAPGISDAFQPLAPGRGHPAGDHPLDAVVLSPGFDRWAEGVDPAAAARWDQLALAARLLARAIASVTAHEMGHAMGLMPNGPPPGGFFGGRPDVTFMGKAHTDSHHADFPGINLMQAGGNPLDLLAEALSSVDTDEDATLVQLFDVLTGENRLSAYERAYLKRQLTYASFE